MWEKCYNFFKKHACSSSTPEYQILENLVNKWWAGKQLRFLNNFKVSGVHNIGLVHLYLKGICSLQRLRI